MAGKQKPKGKGLRGKASPAKPYRPMKGAAY